MSVVVEESNKTMVKAVKTKEIIHNKSQKKHLKTTLIIIGSIIVAIFLFFATITILNISSSTVFYNISVAGINVSKMTREEATSKIQSAVDENFKLQQVLQYGDQEFTMTPSDISAKYDVNDTVELAYSIGRNGNILSDGIDMIKSIFVKKDIPLNFTYSDEKLNDIITKVNDEFSKLKQPSYEIKNKELVITKGERGIVIKSEQLKESILQNILDVQNTPIQIPVIATDPNAINIEQIHDEIYKETKDATYTTDPFTVVPQQDGVDFAISMDDAKKMLEQNQTQYIIPLKYTTPKITTAMVGTKSFPTLLASFTTPYITSKVNRTENLKLAASKINGTIVMPGETFSFNKTVGERTTAAGFKMANMYSGGAVVDGVGGGICQIASTLYNIALLSNLDIVERHNHQFYPGYVACGRDATVYWGSLDFKFKNTRSYPVKISASVGGGYVTMKMYGTKEAVEYDVSISTSIVATYPYKITYQDTSSLKSGKTQVSQYGETGYKSTAYRIIKLNGKVVNKEFLSTDTYNALNEVVLRGTAGASSSSSSSGNSSSNTSSGNTSGSNTNTSGENTAGNSNSTSSGNNTTGSGSETNNAGTESNTETSNGTGETSI